MLFFILGENLKYFLIKFISLDNIYLLVNQINREFVFSHDFFLTLKFSLVLIIDFDDDNGGNIVWLFFEEGSSFRLLFFSVRSKNCPLCYVV
jgi:hypothetical protein